MRGRIIKVLSAENTFKFFDSLFELVKCSETRLDDLDGIFFKIRKHSLQMEITVKGRVVITQALDSVQMDADQVAAVTFQILFMGRDPQTAVDLGMADVMPVAHTLRTVAVEQFTDFL